MIYRIIAILILVAFYSFYFAKLIIQKQQEIKTNQMGTGNKPKKVLLIERGMSVATIMATIVGLVSILFGEVNSFAGFRIASIVIGVLAVVIFAMATITMKSSWRVGIPEEKTTLIKDGIYRFSRNPAFVGFNLLYLSICLMFFNIPLAIISLWAGVMLHLQILQEEEHMQKMFGEEYTEYGKYTYRYFGKR